MRVPLCRVRKGGIPPFFVLSPFFRLFSLFLILFFHDSSFFRLSFCTFFLLACYDHIFSLLSFSPFVQQLSGCLSLSLYRVPVYLSLYARFFQFSSLFSGRFFFTRLQSMKFFAVLSDCKAFLLPVFSRQPYFVN